MPPFLSFRKKPIRMMRIKIEIGKPIEKAMTISSAVLPEATSSRLAKEAAFAAIPEKKPLPVPALTRLNWNCILIVQTT